MEESVWVGRSLSEVAIADETLVQRDVGRAEDGAALAAAVGVTLNGGDAVGDAGAVNVTDDDVRLA